MDKQSVVSQGQNSSISCTHKKKRRRERRERQSEEEQDKARRQHSVIKRRILGKKERETVKLTTSGTSEELNGLD